MTKNASTPKKNGWGGKRANQNGRPKMPDILKLRPVVVRLSVRQLEKLEKEVNRLNKHKSRIAKKKLCRADIFRRLIDLYLT